MALIKYVHSRITGANPVEFGNLECLEMAGHCRYSCESATETLGWIKAIADFIKPFSFLTKAPVVNFFKDRLWEAVDKDWIECLRHEPTENLLLIPSGVVQDHWPVSLKEFVLTLRSLAFPREQADLQKFFPGLQVTSLNNVLAQGMNVKKKHEVEVLSALVNSVANGLRAQTIVDVGAGQGYLAQVLCFQYHHPVVAIDACSHHGGVTNTRAERIKKYFTAQMQKSGSGCKSLNLPKTITCRVISTDALEALTKKSLHRDDGELPKLIGEYHQRNDGSEMQWPCNTDTKTSLVLAGLHACGDLSVTMLKTFMECDEVKGVVSVGCCYNLLSEEDSDHDISHCGFPMSNGVKSAELCLSKNSRDLACQSAERWRSLDSDAGVHNFELHAFRAAFQMVLCKYYPEIITTSPSVGRQGKALRRQQQRRFLESQLDDKSVSVVDVASVPYAHPSNQSTGCGRSVPVDKYLLFEKFCRSGLCRLDLKPVDNIDIHKIWEEAEQFIDMVGPYWSLRAALGPLLETLILLDRLLFIQEQGSCLEALMLPIFSPVLSPRNVAIIAKKKSN